MGLPRLIAIVLIFGLASTSCNGPDRTMGPIPDLTYGIPDRPQGEPAGIFEPLTEEPFGTLTVDGHKRTWRFEMNSTYRDSSSTSIASGLYEIEGDLAVFSGKWTHHVNEELQNSADFRFALNFGFTDGTRNFNSYFRTEDGEYRYHRKWYRQISGAWQPEAEIDVVMSFGERVGNEWPVRFQARRVVWDEAGEAEEQLIDETVTYKYGMVGCCYGEVYWYGQRPRNWIPLAVIRVTPDGREFDVVAKNFPCGILYGFAPMLMWAPDYVKSPE